VLPRVPQYQAPASPLRRGLTLTHVHRLWTAPTSEVGSSVDTCPTTLHRPWAIETKEGLATTACSETRVFPRHVDALLRCLQDVRADGIIMICKPYRQVLQHHATVQHRATDHLHAWRYSATLCS
jgi:hypothetical protein